MTFNPLSASTTKWSNTLKQFVGKKPTNFLSVFDHFVGFVLKGIIFPTCFVRDNQRRHVSGQLSKGLLNEYWYPIHASYKKAF